MEFLIFDVHSRSQMQSLTVVYNKVGVFHPAILLKESFLHTCKFCKIFENTIFAELLRAAASTSKYIGKNSLNVLSLQLLNRRDLCLL